MKRTLSKRTGLAIAALAIVGLCQAVQADVGPLFATQVTNAWPAEANPIIYSSAPLATFAGTSSLSGTAPAAAAAGALANSLSETFTITNGAGTLGGYAGPGTGSNYVLTGVAIIVSGYSATVPCTLHLYDVTSNLTATGGGIYNGAATYNQTTPTTQGDLLGENQGLPFINAAASGAEHILYIPLINGPNTYGDQVVLASNHTYALEISVPTAAAASGAGNFFMFKAVTADPGGQGMGSVNAGNPATSRQTTAALGLTGGPPRTFAIALYGVPATTNSVISVNTLTNVVVTTNYFVDQFNALSVPPGNPYYTNVAMTAYDYSTNTTGTSQIGSIWKDWYNITAPNISWDNTNDAQGNTNGGLGGSMLLQPVFQAGGQIQVFDSTAGDPFGTGIVPNLDASTLGLTSFEADVMFDSSSAVQTNATGGLYFGNLQFGHYAGGSADFIGNVVNVPQSQSNQWVHVKIPINPNDSTLAAIPSVLIHIYGPFGAANAAGDLLGQVKFWVDNIKFKGPLAPPLTPPPALQISKATPGTARFFGTAPQYTRTELASTDTSQSWIQSIGDDGTGGPFSVPVSYSMTVSHLATQANVATRIWLVDADTGTYNGQDYSAGSALWLNITGLTTNSWRAQVAWKAFVPGSNPGNIALTVTNTLGVGTWTLTFTGWTNGNLMAPGWTTASNFTLNVTSVSNNVASSPDLGVVGINAFLDAFVNPLTALFGIEDDNATAIGAYDDFTQISVTNVYGVNELDNFSLDTAIDTTNVWSSQYGIAQPTGVYQITNAAADAGAGFISAYATTLKTPIILVTTNTPYWVTWNVTTNGYGLGESTNGLLPITSLVSPASLSGYLDAPQQLVAGGTNWALIPKDCLPTTNQSYFRIVNPVPQF